jgi:dihydroorotate dehydrogenase electron transfer subunit
MIEAKCQIIEKNQIGKDIYIVTFENAVIASKAKPGQFVHINIGPGSVIRRPFSIYDTHRDTFSILFQTIGSGTKRLVTYRPGQFLYVIGPLGHGFPIEGGSPVLVGGGMGAASLKLLHKHLLKEKVNVEVLLGFRGSAVAVDWPKSQVATEDGSLGSKGLVADLLAGELQKGGDVVYACGPEAMLKEVSAIAEKQKVKAYVCLERFMACGVGACLSCVCETKYGLSRVCKEGPVFNSQDVIWDGKRAQKDKN